MHANDNFHPDLAAWAEWLTEAATQPCSRPYLLTLTFDRYRDRYFRSPSSAPAGATCAAITRMHVQEGMTGKLTREQAAAAFVGDVNRWYLRLLHALLGGNYRKHGRLHPVGVGWIDSPVAKLARSSLQPRRLSTEEFPHAHIVMVVRGGAPGEATLVSCFEKHLDSGALQNAWRQFNTGGELHATVAYDIAGALDYAAKTAKRDAVLRLHDIILPFQNWGRKSPPLPMAKACADLAAG